MRILLLAAFLVPVSLNAQVRQLRATPDPSFDASTLELSSPPGIRVNRQNQVFVTDREGKRIVRLSPDGRELTNLVREGAGPGEAKGIHGLSWKGDTLYFVDNLLSRFSLHDSAGKFLKTVAMSDRCSRWGGGLMEGDGCFEYLSPPSAPSVDTRKTPFPIVITSRQRSRTDTLGLMSQQHSVMQFVPANGDMSMSVQPFSDDPLILPIQSGQAAIELRGLAATSPRPDSVLVRGWTPANGWGRWLAIRYEPRPLEPRVIDSALTQHAKRLTRYATWVTRDSLDRKAFRPAYYPPAPQMVIPSEGGLWIRIIDRKVPQGSTLWVALDERLVERARVTVPSAFRPLDVRGELVWGYVLDGDDVPMVFRYRLVPM